MKQKQKIVDILCEAGFSFTVNDRVITVINDKNDTDADQTVCIELVFSKKGFLKSIDGKYES